MKLLFAWYDLWIGVFVDPKKNLLYVFPIPMLGLMIKLPIRRYAVFYQKHIPVCRNLSLKQAKSHMIDQYGNPQADMSYKGYWAKHGTPLSYPEDIDSKPDPIFV